MSDHYNTFSEKSLKLVLQEEEERGRECLEQRWEAVLRGG